MATEKIEKEYIPKIQRTISQLRKSVDLSQKRLHALRARIRTLETALKKTGDSLFPFGVRSRIWIYLVHMFGGSIADAKALAGLSELDSAALDLAALFETSDMNSKTNSRST